MTKDQWIWMPHPGHFICSFDCRFRLNTCVGKYIVSTVGELFPDAPVREIHAEVRGIKLEGMGDARKADFFEKCGYVELGLDRLYETMVFEAIESEEKDSCCPYRIKSGSELDMRGYNDPVQAFKGHMELCEEWSKK